MSDNIIFDNSVNKLRAKLKIAKFNRRGKDFLHKKLANYTEGTETKLLLIEKIVKSDYTQKNNLNKPERKAVKKVRRAVKKKQIVVCKSHKGVKIVFVKYYDNDTIEKELRNFSQLMKLWKQCKG